MIDTLTIRANKLKWTDKYSICIYVCLFVCFTAIFKTYNVILEQLVQLLNKSSCVRQYKLLYFVASDWLLPHMS